MVFSLSIVVNSFRSLRVPSSVYLAVQLLATTSVLDAYG